MANILICDDEKDIVSALKIYLEAEGYTTYTAYTGKQALDVLQQREIHLVLMDVMMPEMDGITAISLLRRQHNLPVILLTAKGEDTDKVLGLNVGADDYVAKPFNPVELLARVRSQLRRYMNLGGHAVPAAEAERCWQVGGLSMDDRRKQVTLDGEPVSLTPTEYDILKLCMSHPDEVLSPKEIYRRVWQEDPLGSEGVVAVHIRHLREKIEIDPADPRYIKVVWGQGYKLDTGGGGR
ncbi:MAG: response regulator transcription factor [Clostridia bacterium]|nr:response regulator transcription factor [Clostridia bacterium]